MSSVLFLFGEKPKRASSQNFGAGEPRNLFIGVAPCTRGPSMVLPYRARDRNRRAFLYPVFAPGKGILPYFSTKTPKALKRNVVSEVLRKPSGITENTA